MQHLDLLAQFYEMVKEDGRIGPTHISVYMALFHQWQLQNFQHPISISKNKIMPVAKVCSRHTYNQCMKELEQYGYIKYVPSANPLLESVVYFQQPPLEKNKAS